MKKQQFIPIIIIHKEEAHRAVRAAVLEVPEVPMLLTNQLPYSSAESMFVPRASIGANSPAHILGSTDAYNGAAEAFRQSAGIVLDDLLRILHRMNDVVETDLQLPHTSAQVELVATKLGLLVPELKGILDKVADVTQRQSASMLSIAGGGPGLVMFGPLAESYRLEMETCLRGVVLDYRDYAQQARAAADEFDRRADELVPELSATRWEDRITGGMTIRVEVPDQTRIDLATAQIDSLRYAASIYRREAVRIDHEATQVEEGIRYSFAIFETDCNECINCDTYYAGLFAGLADEMRQLAGKIKDIYNSFCPSAGITDWGLLQNVKSQFSQSNQNELFGLMVNAMVAQMLDDGDGEIRWEFIEAILNRPADQIHQSEFAALAIVFLSLEDDGDIELFFHALADLNEGIGDDRLHGWTFCNDKIDGIHQFMLPRLMEVFGPYSAIANLRPEQFIESLSGEHLAQLRAMFPGLDNEALRVEVRNMFGDKYNRHAQNFALFSDFGYVASGISNHWQAAGTGQMMIAGHDPTKPPIIVSREGGSLVMQFDSFTFSNAVGGAVTWDPQSHNITAFPGQPAVLAFDHLLQDAERFMMYTIAPSGVTAVFLGKSSDAIAGELVSAGVKVVLGEIPFVSTGIKLVGGTVSAVVSGAETYAQMTTTVERVTDNFREGNVATMFDLNVVVTDHGVGQQIVHLFPGTSMEAEIVATNVVLNRPANVQHVNDVLNSLDSNLDIINERGEFEITAEHVLTNPVAVYEFIHELPYFVGNEIFR